MLKKIGDIAFNGILSNAERKKLVDILIRIGILSVIDISGFDMNCCISQPQFLDMRDL